jgi:hypothetical protein
LIAVLADWQGFREAEGLRGVSLGQFAERQHEGHIALGSLGHFQCRFSHLLGISTAQSRKEIFESGDDLAVATGFAQDG